MGKGEGMLSQMQEAMEKELEGMEKLRHCFQSLN